jgi:hypoxanthine phosphoribosyltransferase
MSDAGLQCEVMSWELFDELSQKVASNIIESRFHPDIIVGLARGGWVLSRVLCDHLGVKDLLSLKVEHWGITATPDGKAQIKYPFKIDLTGKKILIVDDITDTGESMIVAINYIEELNPKEIKTAALRHIQGSKYTPDYYGDEITWRWVVFPWNYIEDMCNIIPKIMEKSESFEEIKQQLESDYNIQLTNKDIQKILGEINRRKKHVMN